MMFQRIKNWISKQLDINIYIDDRYATSQDDIYLAQQLKVDKIKEANEVINKTAPKKTRKKTKDK